MSSSRKSISFKTEAERRFLYRVDVEVPSSFGFGQTLNLMLSWCREHLNEGDWAQHGFVDKTVAERLPKDFARFYFEQLDQAIAFVDRWIVVEGWRGKLQGVD